MFKGALQGSSGVAFCVLSSADTGPLDQTGIDDVRREVLLEQGADPAPFPAGWAGVRQLKPWRFGTRPSIRVPSAIEQVRCILAIPQKKTDEALVDYLVLQELQALIDAPDPTTFAGTRDRAMIHLGFAAGLRVSELIGLLLDDLQTHPHAFVRVRGKGRRERVLPLWKETVRALRAWLAVRRETSTPELFLNARGGPLTRSGFEYILAKHVQTAAAACPSISSKRVSPHILRHTCAMHLLQATHDVRKVSLWLGHASVKSTEIYLRADPSEKLAVLEESVAPSLRRGRFQPPDKLLDMLRSS